MGRLRKRFNAKARSDGSAQTQEIEKVDIVIDIDAKDKYDASNPLVLAGKKKKVKAQLKEQVVRKPLSKKQRKKLEKIVEKKKKNLNRAELLRKLSEVQANAEDLSQLTSTSEMQTFGIKRLISESPISSKRRKISNIKGVNKRSELSVKVDTDNELSDTDDNISDKSDDMCDEEEDVSDNEEDVSCVNEVEKKSPSFEEESGDIDKPNKDFEVKEMEQKDKVDINVQNEVTKADAIPTVFVPVYRKPEIQAARQALPIFSEEQPLVEAIKENSVVIIHGETGSGKTTQVPQFLYEAGFTQNNMLIGITEPRRIAAMTMAARVGEEMDMPNAVSYHIRYEKTVNPETQIKFMTDGVLLKEIKQDFCLSRYSVIIIDEAHERSVFSDVLIGLLSRIVRRNQIKKKKYPPLKLIIMSATMCVEEFLENSRLFKNPPFLFKVSSRQYTVQAHFNKHTPVDYVEAAYNKVCKIHRQLPPGAILVFLTGEKEINQLCKLLRDTFPRKNCNDGLNAEEEKSSFKELKKRRKKSKKEQSEQLSSLVPDINLDDFTIEPLDTEDLQHQLSEDEDEETKALKIQKFEDCSSPLYVLPLYSVLPLKEQEKVFKPPPPDSRLCVVATNIAETSITIPGLKYVVDSGKVKSKVYSSNTGGISQFVITWCSKASANQRTGRAGRTEGGHCYRLYSSAIFENEFPDFCIPEIQRIPADDVLLQMKALGIPRVVDFPFPSPPDIEALKSAEKRLILLGALKEPEDKTGSYKELKEREFSGTVTEFGKVMARFPLSPRYAAMLLLSKKHDCVPYIIAIICAMTVSEVFVSSTVTIDGDVEEESENVKIVWEGIKKIGAGNGHDLRLGDAMVLLRSVALFEEAKDAKKEVKFCIKNSIRHRAMVEIHKMGLQLLKEMNQAFSNLDLPIKMILEYPSEETIQKLRKILAAGFIDHIARKLPIEEGKKDKRLKNAYKCMELEEPVFIHPSSILFNELPEYVVYQEIIHTSKYYMKGIIEIENHWIPGFAPSLCEFSKPKDDPLPSYDKLKDKILVTMDVTFGCWTWEVANIEMPKGQLKYQWFCFFLLDGQVCPFFRNYRTLFEPSTVLKKWAKTFKPDIIHFLNELILQEVDSRISLETMWEKNTQYLLKQYLALLPSEKHLEIESKWPPKS